VANIMGFLHHSGVLQTPSVARALSDYLPVARKLA